MASPRVDKVLRSPAYPFTEAAHYLQLPESTLRAWCLGSPAHAQGPRRFEPLIRMDDPSQRALSFLNLIEVHVLAAIRRQHRVPLPTVRRALDFLGQRLRASRPLAELQFQTDGVDLFVDRLGNLINASEQGQTEMAELLRQRLQRIERNTQGLPVRLFPFARADSSAEEVAPVLIDPHVAFGRPVLVGRSVPTSVLADRFRAGDSCEAMAADYGTTAQTIEAALRCELDGHAR